MTMKFFPACRYRPNELRFVPLNRMSLYMRQGWTLVDDGEDCRKWAVLMAPPEWVNPLKANKEIGGESCAS